MKIRNGFVSNSSSTSFTCDFCGCTYSGMDIGLADAEMRACENGHTFCYSHMDKTLNDLTEEELREALLNYCSNSQYRTELAKTIKNANDEELKYHIDLLLDEEPEKLCPLCTFKAISNNDFIRYIYGSTGKTEADFIKEIKEQIKTYKEFVDKFGKKCGVVIRDCN